MEEDWDKVKQKERKREIGEDHEGATKKDSRCPKRKREEENVPLYKLCIPINDPNPIDVKPNSPLFDALIPTPEKEEKQREEEGGELDHIRLLPPKPHIH